MKVGAEYSWAPPIGACEIKGLSDAPVAELLVSCLSETNVIYVLSLI